MLIKMSIKLIYYGVMYQIKLYLFNALIYFKINQKSPLSSPFLVKVSNMTGGLIKKCDKIDTQIKEKMNKY